MIDEDVHEDIHTNVSRDVRKVTNNFERFCETSFTHTNMFSGMPFVSKPRYHTGPLETALKQTYTHDHLFGWSQTRAISQSKVAVTCSLNTGKSVVLSNYNRPNLDDGRYSLHTLKHHLHRSDHFFPCLQLLPRAIRFPSPRAGSTGVESLGSVSHLPKFVDCAVLKY
jgi:hypothetical protein